jgi:potassium efflux system protein
MSRWALPALIAVLLLLTRPVFSQTEPDPTAELAAARSRLEKLGEPKTEDAKRWKAAIEKRIALLEESIRTAKESGELLDAAEIERRQKAVAADLAAEQARPGPESAGLRSLVDLPKFEEASRGARAEREKASTLVKETGEKRDRAQEELKSLPARDTAAKRARADLTGEDELTLYLKGNLDLDIRVTAARQQFLARALKSQADIMTLRQRELDLAQARLDRETKLLELARGEADAFRAGEAAREKEKARAEKEAARREADPIRRFERLMKADAADARSRVQSANSAADDYDTRIRETKEAIERIRAVREHLTKRLQYEDPGLTELLSHANQSADKRSQTLVLVSMPALTKESAEAQKELIDLLDRIWKLHLPAEENPELAKLLAELPEDRREEGSRAFTKATEGADRILDALRKQRTALENLTARQGQLAAQQSELEQELRHQMEFCQAKLLFSRSHDPLSLAIVADAAREAPALLDAYADPILWQESLEKVRHVPRGAALLLILSVLTVTVVIVPRVIRARRRKKTASADPASFLGGGLAFLSLLRAVSPPAGLYFAGAFVQTLELPSNLGAVLPRVLFLLAQFLLLRRTAAWFLQPRGVAIHGLNFTPGNADRLARIVKTLTSFAMLLAVPAMSLDRLPGFVYLPRLLDTLWIVVLAYFLIRLLARRGPVIGQLATRGGFLDRLWLVVGPVLALGIVALVAVDLAGYRVASHAFFTKVSESFLIVLGIAILYAILVRSIRSISTRVRRRLLAVEGKETAQESSNEVHDQLTRIAAVAIVVLALYMLLRSWDQSRFLLQYLGGIRLAETDPGQHLTLLRLIQALLVIVGGHYLVANLSALFGALVFPLLGNTNAGGRYVAIALSRYVILLVAYSAALLMIGFKFSSLAWLFTAASVGIGFGLQEIIANFVSGLIILIERPIQVGDTVSLDTIEGEVEKITIRATIVTNWDRQSVVIPNKDFITKKLTNWTRNDDIMRRRIDVKVAFGTDIGKVIARLSEIVTGHPAVLDDPPHRIWASSFEEEGLGFRVFFFTKISDGLTTRAELHQQIFEGLAAEGIEIPVPKRRISVIHEPDAEAGTSPR